MPLSAKADSLKTILVEALQPYASRVELFGSVARAEADDESDLDVLVTLRPASDRPPLGLKWFKLERRLSGELGRTVELVTDNALSPHLRPHIESDRVLLYQDESEEYLGECGTQDGREKYDAALEQVPDVEPDERDQIE